MFPDINEKNNEARGGMKQMWNILNTNLEPQWIREQRYPELRPPITRSLDMSRHNIISARGLQNRVFPNMPENFHQSPNFNRF